MKPRKPIKRKRGVRRGPARIPAYRKYLRDDCTCVICNQLIKRHEYHLVPNDRSALWPDPAHTVNNGTSSKGPDSSCAPLCRTHHREYDAGRLAFEHKYKIDMKAIAAQYYAQWISEGNKP